jgi:hypothetical protein
MKPLVIDIETGPAHDEALELVMPEFKAPSNYKDPEKIEASIASQKEEWKARAALSPVTGRVLALGLMRDADNPKFITGPESDLLEAAWDALSGGLCLGHLVIGFCSNRFDIPFLVRRSWALGVKVPGFIFRDGYRLSNLFVDIMDVYQCGDRSATINLDTLAKLLGLPGKNGNGADFARLLSENREAAIAYLENDLRVTWSVAERLGIIRKEEDK